MPEAEIIPLTLSASSALKTIRALAADSNNIVWVQHAKKRGKQRSITRRQVELCCQRGTIVEGPFLNQWGNWQVSLYRHGAGEELTCAVAIDWATKLIVITTF